MSQDVFKAPKAKRKHSHKKDSEKWSPKKRRRTKEDFNMFCSIVLEYTQYETLKQEELRRCNNTSPLDSAGSTADSFTSESTSSSISESDHDDKFLEGTTPHLVGSHMSNDENSNSSFFKTDHEEDGDDSRDDINDSPPSMRSELKNTIKKERKEERKKRNSHSSGKSDSSNDESGDEDSWELVTCYCMKPFSGRPMIECSECLTWIHLSCAKIRKSNIPDNFVCQKCREAKFTMRKSSRIRSEKKMINA